MRTESLSESYLALPDATGRSPGLVVVHEAYGLNDNIRDICRRFADEGYAALGVDLFAGRNRAVCTGRLRTALLGCRRGKVVTQEARVGPRFRDLQ